MDYLTSILVKIMDFDVQNSIDNFFKKNKDFILELNKEQLHDDGVRSDGSLIGQYSEFTKIMKKRKGQRYDHITLRDRGDFYRSFKLGFKDNELIFDAKAVKMNKGKKTDLFQKYGIDVMGLTDENKEYVLILLKDEIIKDFEKAIEL